MKERGEKFPISISVGQFNVKRYTDSKPHYSALEEQIKSLPNLRKSLYFFTCPNVYFVSSFCSFLLMIKTESVKRQYIVTPTVSKEEAYKK